MLNCFYMKKIVVKTVRAPFALFPVLVRVLNGKVNTLLGKNLVFTEEKFSLMTERRICDAFGGTFNTDVYSFGSFLRGKIKNVRVLGKEGLTMVVKKSLDEAELKCFKSSTKGLAPNLFELIMQLKSACVGVDEIKRGADSCSGILKDKLTDVATVYEAYEKFIKDKGLFDQSGTLSLLPEIIKGNTDIKKADVYLVGFSSFTAQERNIIRTLAEECCSLTAILVSGSNDGLYSNETVFAVEKIGKELGIKVEKSAEVVDFSDEVEEISRSLFTVNRAKTIRKSDKISLIRAFSPRDEIRSAAEIIKKGVFGGKRYSDFTIALPDVTQYAEEIEEVFSELEIPYFLDKKEGIFCHPLTRLVLSYVEVFRRKFERSAVCAFVKNPYISEDKTLTDGFCAYLYKNGVDYGRIFKEFKIEADDLETTKYEKLRQDIILHFKKFDIDGLLKKTQAQEKTEILSEKLVQNGTVKEGSVSARAYESVCSVLEQMQAVLDFDKIDYYEFKNIFTSGVSALEVSVIPQYSDAVFIGGYKETAIAKANELFMLGLTDDVPFTKEDVALLSDGDIKKLDEIRVLVEPKIKVVNRREKESVGLAMLAFDNKLYLSYPFFKSDEKQSQKSEAITQIEQLFEVKKVESNDGYLTKKQGLYSFASDCGKYVYGENPDFERAAAYYFACDESDECRIIAEYSGKTLKERLDGASAIRKGKLSPTAIEDFYVCPYKSFAQRYLRISENDDGEITAANSGSFVHEVLKEAVAEIEKILSEDELREEVKKIIERVLTKSEFSNFSNGAKNKFFAKGLSREIEKFCSKMYRLFKGSRFRSTKDGLELRFGDGANLPPIKLLDGKIKLEGVIDRVDVYGDYCRVIDYKTGTTHAENKYLYAGTKLQLYLYAAVLKDKKIAGLYYFPVSDAFKSSNDADAYATGKTLDDENIILAQDENAFLDDSFLRIGEQKNKNGLIGEKELKGCVAYALAMSEKAAKEMDGGVIVASPFENACEFCPYGAMCDGERVEPRKAGAVANDYFMNATEEDDA